MWHDSSPLNWFAQGMRPHSNWIVYDVCLKLHKFHLPKNVSTELRIWILFIAVRSTIPMAMHYHCSVLIISIGMHNSCRNIHPNRLLWNTDETQAPLDKLCAKQPDTILSWKTSLYSPLNIPSCALWCQAGVKEAECRDTSAWNSASASLSWIFDATPVDDCF